MTDFILINDKKNLTKLINLDNNKVHVRFEVNHSEFSKVDNINWVIVNGIIDLIQTNINEHKVKAKKFLKFLIENCELYDIETIERIKDFQLIAIEIIEPFGKHPQLKYTNYRLQFDFISDYHVDTYGLLNVMFMDKYAIGVERIFG